MKVMSSKVESEIQAFNVELEKFSSRWQQLKPRDDIATGGDTEATALALASLKERRAEFNELVSTANKLRLGRGGQGGEGRERGQGEKRERERAERGQGEKREKKREKS